MVIGLETAKLGIGKINVIDVESGVILKGTVLTVQNRIAGANAALQCHVPDHCLVDVEEAAAQVTSVAATVDHPAHQGGMLGLLC